MRKKFLLLLTILSFSLFVSACHGSKGIDSFALPETFDTSKNYEITFWAKNDTNLTQVDIYKKAIADFESLYPNIKVNMRIYTDYGRIYNDVITNISTRTTPNVCITYPDHIATYLTGNNVVVPLDELISNEKYGLNGRELKYDAPGEIVPNFLNECKLGENIYAIPYMRSTEACYINKTLVNALGYDIPKELTWDFIYEVSKKAVEKDSDGNFLINGQKVMIPFIYKSTDNFMIQMLKQLDAPYSDTDGNNYLFNDTTTSFLYDIRDLTSVGAFSTFKISSYPGNFLNAGQCIFAIDSTAGATWMGSKAPNLDISEDKLVDFEMVVTTIPQADPENPQMISQGPSVCVFNKEDSDEVLASWLFAQYLITCDVQIAYSETEGYIPVTKKALESPVYKEYLSIESEDDPEHYAPKIQAAKLLIDNIENTFTAPVFNGSASLRDASGQLIENVTKSVRRNETVDDAYMNALYDNTFSLYHLDQTKKANSDGASKEDLGPLPGTSVLLICLLLLAWISIAVTFICRTIIAKHSEK